MNEKDIETLENELEATKEVVTLDELKSSALENMESLYTEEFDEQLEEADQQFQTKVEENLEMVDEEKQVVTKQPLNSNKSLKEKWHSLDKKKKIFIIVGIVALLLIILGTSLFFLLRSEEPLSPPKEPDVILESDNYRYENGKLIFLNGDTELGSYDCTNKQETLCGIATAKINDTIDGVKRVNENGEALSFKSKIYFERFTFLIDHKNEEDKSILLYDIKEQKVLKTIYDLAIFHEYDNYVLLKNEDGCYGLEKVEENAVTLLIPYDYDEIHLLKEEAPTKVVVRKANNSYLANMNNNILTKAIANSIVSANEKYIAAKDSLNKYHVYDYNGNEVMKDILPDYITLLAEYLIYVKDNKLYAVDYSGNRYFKDPLELYNPEYTPVEIFKDLKQQETKKSFDYELVNQRLTINIYNGSDSENHSYNLLEGKLSSRYPFIEYLDGTMHFYADEKKQEKIGTYPCKNINKIEKDTDVLHTCFLAKDSFYREINGNKKEIDKTGELGVIPMINRRYIFMQDGEEIVFYDLKEQKELAFYESVDTSSYTNVNDITFTMSSNFTFIAKSFQSKKYGVVTITNDGVTPILKFEYNSIKRLGEYYVVESDDGFKLVQLNGTVVEMEAKKNPIVDYHKNYFKTYDGNQYFVHTLTETVKDSYDYIELYDEFYAAVLNKVLHLYRYDDKEDKKTDYLYDEKEENNGLPLTEKDLSKAFSITIQKDTILVTLPGEKNPLEFSTKPNLDKKPIIDEPIKDEDEEDKDES